MADAVADYLQALRAAALAHLGDALVGVYTTGSLALDGYVPGRSDIDAIVIAEDRTPKTSVRGFAEAISHPHLACPAAGLELSVIRRTAAARWNEPGYLLEINTGPELPFMLNFEPTRSPSWFVIDRAVARQSGLAVFGPPAGELIGAVPKAKAIAVMVEALDYQLEQLGQWQTDTVVLNACRALRFTDEERWFSKPAAGEWAAGRDDTDAQLIRLALDTHHNHGRTGADLVPLEPARAFITAVRNRVLGR